MLPGRSGVKHAQDAGGKAEHVADGVPAELGDPLRRHGAGELDGKRWAYSAETIMKMIPVTMSRPACIHERKGLTSYGADFFRGLSGTPAISDPGSAMVPGRPRSIS